MRWRMGILSVLGLAAWGCGPPEVAPMTPPGVVFPRVVDESDTSEALGEKLSRGTVQAPNVAPGGDPANARPGATPAEGEPKLNATEGGRMPIGPGGY